MSGLLALASLRSLVRHPWQIALSILGVALGVAVVVGIDLASVSALRAFELSAESMTGRATHALRGGPSGFDEALYTRLRRAYPDLQLAPVVEHDVRTVGAERRTLTLFGIDPIADAALRPWFGRGGGGGSGARASGRSAALIVEQGAALLASDTAKGLGVAIGDELSLRVDSKIASVRISDLLEPKDDLSRRALENLLIVDVSTAQELLGRVGSLTRVDVVLPPGPSGEALLARLRAELPAGTELEPAAARSQSTADMTRAFDLNLRALALLALLVGMFLIYNTMTFSVVRRRALLGALRTLGVSRAQVFRAVWSEALWIGSLGTALGLVLGVELSRYLVELSVRTLNDLYFTVSVSRIDLAPSVLAKGALLGLGASLAGTLAPALEASRSAPRVVQLRSTLEARTKSLLPRLALGGILLGALAALCLWLPGQGLGFAFLGLFGMLCAFALLAPVLTVALARMASVPLGAVLGLFGRQAARGVVANLSRTSVAIAALAIALSSTVGMGVMVASFRATLVRWLDITLQADAFVSAPSLVSSRNTSTLDPALIELVRREPGIDAISTYRGVLLDSAAGPLNLAAIELPERGLRAFHFMEGRPEEIWRAFEADGAAIVSESFAWRHGVEVGGTIELPTDRGPHAFPVAGIFYDYTSDRGFAMLARATYEQFWRDRAVSSIGLFTTATTDVDELVVRVRALVPEDQEVLVRSNKALREGSMFVFERTFAITNVLRLLATAVAFVGVLSALLALELERERELGVLRALGALPRQVGLLVVTETGLMGVIAGLLALPLGLVLALILILVVNRRSFGWTLEIELAPSVFASAFFLALFAALVAGLYPAWRMSRTRPALALRGE